MASPGVLWKSPGRAASSYSHAQSLHPWPHTWTGVQTTSMSQAPAEGQYCVPGLPASPQPPRRTITDSTIKNTILCSLVAPGDRHPNVLRLLASWPDGGCCHPPTLTDHGRREGVCHKTRALSFPAHGSVGGADTVGDSYAAQRDHMPLLLLSPTVPTESSNVL